jgi:S-adenosylmethionine:tRNA ribosyltransferase-isomerase
MRVDQFDFELPERLIALRPANPRDSARLMVVKQDGSHEHRLIRDLPGLLQRGDVLVVNSSRVIPARLRGTRHRAGEAADSGAKFEVLLHRRTAPAIYRAFARPAKRLKPGDAVWLGQSLRGRVTVRDGAEIEIAFEIEGAELDRAIAALGEMPLPPYIVSRRSADAKDLSDYQTVYAREPGSVAAPTAGLHFTPELLEQLREAGIHVAEVTLHVGPGTFLPVTAENTENHVMHSEWAELPPGVAEQLNQTRAAGGRIAAVGSTALRTLETAADDNGVIHPLKDETALFITPGYRFKAVDVLLTNFHLPRSTLFMLVCAFSGMDVMKRAYAEAIAAEYRFYSYGDACLLFRP